MKVVILKYNAGNIQSVSFALERLGINFSISDKVEEIQSADKVIFPGVGEAGTTMNYLKSKGLDQVIKNLKQPVLGICLGMQLMCAHSEEGDTPCIGIFDENVKKFIPSKENKVPHIGWNQLSRLKDWPADLPEGSSVYFVHSYYVPVNQYTTAITSYSVPFSAAMRKDNFYAVQFHPEKSSLIGETILKNFLNIKDNEPINRQAS
ncbi:MAG: imidazole glycerol phosphate synthase subunit HisH [Cyclobacteriaceae bacterium]|nr:imidazole glycerol phosphate synthase subunit HisH [Cyclobacteriaceae bacterium]